MTKPIISHSRKEDSQQNGRGLTGLAIRNHVTVLVIVFLLCIYGFSSYFGMSKQQDPGFTIRQVMITAAFPGVNASRIEQLVTDRIEEVIQEIPEVDFIESKSRTGLSIVQVNFQEKYTEMRPIFNNVRRKIDDLKEDGTLPQGVIGPNVNDEFGDVFGLLYALRGEGFSNAELKDIADKIRSKFLSIEDVAKVDIHGVRDEVIYVEYDGARLQKIGLSPTMISAALSNANILQGGGDIRIGQERILLEPTGSFDSLESLKKTVLRLPSGRVIYLGDIATIRRGYEDPADAITRYNGDQSLILAISLREGGDILALNDRLDAATPAIEASFPYGISLKKVFSQPKLVKNAINSFMSNLLQAIVIVAAVMFLFLGLRTGIIVAALIPTTVLVTFVIMSALGITINQISLAALIIALGLLVDNAIVMAEGIMIRREKGENKYQAAISAGREMALPLLISSLTTAAAFLCIFLAESAVGEYTSDIFKVVSIALLSSWLLAMTFIPITTTILMKVKVKTSSSHNHNSEDTDSGIMYRVYHRCLHFSLRHRWVPILMAVSLFILAIWALRFVPNVFIPERRDPIIYAKFNLPRGTDIQVNNAVIKDLETYMLQRYAAKNEENGIIDLLSFVGISAPRFVLTASPDQPDTHIASMIIEVTDDTFIPDIISDVEHYAAVAYPDLEVKMRKLENGTPINYPIEVRITGDDISELYRIIAPIKADLLSIDGVRDVSDDWGPRRKKLKIDVNQDRARRAGVTNADVALSLETGLSGLVMTEFREDNDIIPIMLRSVVADRDNLSKLDGLIVYAQGSDESVPLKQVADTSLVWEDAIIKRRNRTRTISVRTLHYPDVTATDVISTFMPMLRDQQKTWPAGYTVELGGEAETSSDASQAIVDKLPISGMLILLLLVAQFNSIKKTAIILCTIPLGMIGITFGLIVAKSIFGFFTILGLISLSGIIINNAIVLIDRIGIEEAQGRSPSDAVVSACQQRLRPILLTTLTTVGGMLPLWISRDPMFETMAVTIIFGLLFATLLTLLIVPVLYSLFYRIRFN